MNILKTCTLSALTLALTNAYASTESSQTAMEEIVVSGQKYARLKALDVKRNAIGVMDALSTDNLGRLPDKNAAESLNRLPGVSVLIEKGEGQFASIRGIKPDWNNVTINGFTTGSPEKDGSGRQMPLDILGGELLETIEVFKARTPDMDGQGIGGSINIVTKKPLAGDDFQGTVNIRAGIEGADQDNPYYDNETPYNGDVTLSGKLNENWGWILGASTNHRQYLAQGIYQDDWSEVGGISFPEQTKNNYYVVGRDRDTFSAGLEYKASESTSFMFEAFASEFDEFQHRNRFRKGIEPDAQYIENVGDNAFTVTNDGLYVRADLRREDTNKKLQNYTLTGETLLQDWQFNYGINYGHNEIYETNHNWDFRQDSNVNLGSGTVNIASNGITDLQLNSGNTNDVTNFRFNGYENPTDTAEQDIVSAKFDAGYTYMFQGLVGELKFGVKYTDSDKSFDNTALEYDVARQNLSNYAVTGGSFQNDVNGFLQDNLWMDLGALNSLFASQPALFTAQTDANTLNSILGDKRVQERTKAIYAMNSFDFDSWSLIFGARWEQTDVDSDAYQSTDDGVVAIESNGSSSELLPSILANYHISDDLILRASWTKSLGRPDYGDISAASTFSIDENGEGNLNIGNPNLEPYLSDNYDLSLEWYFEASSILSLAAFKKDVDNMIVSDTQTIDSGVYAGQDYNVDTLNVVTTKNSDSATIEGFEFNAQYQFNVLPAPFNNLGANYSYTSIDANFYDSELAQERKLEGQPETLQSLTLYYDHYDFYVGLTYNYNADFLTDINSIDDPQDDITQGEFGRWDLRASYNVNDSLMVYADINNINDEPTTEFQAGNEQWATEYEYVGRTYYIGATYSF